MKNFHFFVLAGLVSLVSCASETSPDSAAHAAACSKMTAQAVVVTSCTPSAKSWPDGILYYQIDGSLEKKWGRSIREYIDREFSQRLADDKKYPSNFRFVESNTAKNRVLIQAATGDQDPGSPVGMQGGVQPLYLALGSAPGYYEADDETQIFDLAAFYGVKNATDQKLWAEWRAKEFMGMLGHELMHAAGFQHEHERCDRDKYVVPDEGLNMAVLPAPDCSGKNFVVGQYDYSSLTHYLNFHAKPGHPADFQGDPDNIAGGRRNLFLLWSTHDGWRQENKYPYPHLSEGDQYIFWLWEPKK